MSNEETTTENTMAKKTWRELKAEGVQRCPAYFKSGKRCARPAADQRRGGFCKKHGFVDRIGAPDGNDTDNGND